MKQSRENAFSSSRNIDIERKVRLLFLNLQQWNLHFPSITIQKLVNTINNFIAEELAQEIDNDIELHETILKEIIDNWEQWQAEEIEKSMDWLMNVEDQEQVFCPVCEHSLLSLNENVIRCDGCGLR